MPSDHGDRPFYANPDSTQTHAIHIARDWLSHIAAGRIGAGPSTTAEQLLVHMRNEEAVLGRSVSVRLRRGDGR